ncbi:MAG: low specificity L-threonine aldolase [Candidatus Bathyarchaeia archaeon]
MKVIDFRSDTVTLPTSEMLEAILTAPLGDDGFRDDPTVLKLEELAAEKTGKEAALLVPSGTQGNAVSVLAQAEPGDQIILGARSHILNTERGHFAVIGGLISRPLRDDEGCMDPQEVEATIRPKRPGSPGTALVCIENTHNSAGGIALSPEQTKAIWDVAQDRGVSMHTDGARIFNAAVYHGVDVKEFTRYTDSVMFCLSKGLSAPIGSMVCGTEEFIRKARNVRRMLGGMMRQAGVIAAPGIIALTKMVDRLKEDHETCRMLAEGLEKLGAKILHPVQTNMIYVDISGLGFTGSELREKLASFGVKIGGGVTRLRLVTHRGIEKEDIAFVLECIEKVRSG